MKRIRMFHFMISDFLSNSRCWMTFHYTHVQFGPLAIQHIGKPLVSIPHLHDVHLITFSSLKKKLRVARSPGNQAATSGTADPAVSTWVPFEKFGNFWSMSGKNMKQEMNKITKIGHKNFNKRRFLFSNPFKTGNPSKKLLLFIGNFIQHVQPMIVKLKRSILQQFSSSRRPSEGFDFLTGKWMNGFRVL